ncbi:MAG: alpha/beta hydrolase [Haloferacaceae archaeon]
MRSELHPEVRELLNERAEAGTPRNHQLSVQGTRKSGQTERTAAASETDQISVGSVRDYLIPGPDGHEQSLPVRIYTPSGSGPFPIAVWFHGGYFVRGSLDSNDRKCRYLTKHAECAVMAVDYRLAPENPFPAAVHDAYAAVKWAAENPEILLGDADRLAVAGSSAGGNLAAAVSLMARDRDDGPDIGRQVLGVPVLDLAFDLTSPVVELDRPRSFEENAEGYGLTREEMVLNRDLYLEDEIDAFHPYASPLRARDLSGLPPTLIITAGFDPLRDDGWAYAERLRETDVSVEHSHYDDMPHSVTGSTFLRRGITPTVNALEEMATELREGL